MEIEFPKKLKVIKFGDLPNGSLFVTPGNESRLRIKRWAQSGKSSYNSQALNDSTGEESQDFQPDSLVIPVKRISVTLEEE